MLGDKFSLRYILDNFTVYYVVIENIMEIRIITGSTAYELTQNVMNLINTPDEYGWETVGSYNVIDVTQPYEKSSYKKLMNVSPNRIFEYSIVMFNKHLHNEPQSEPQVYIV